MADVIKKKLASKIPLACDIQEEDIQENILDTESRKTDSGEQSILKNKKVEEEEESSPSISAHGNSSGRIPVLKDCSTDAKKKSFEKMLLDKDSLIVMDRSVDEDTTIDWIKPVCKDTQLDKDSKGNSVDKETPVVNATPISQSTNQTSRFPSDPKTPIKADVHKLVAANLEKEDKELENLNKNLINIIGNFMSKVQGIALPLDVSSCSQALNPDDSVPRPIEVIDFSIANSSETYDEYRCLDPQDRPNCSAEDVDPQFVEFVTSHTIADNLSVVFADVSLTESAPMNPENLFHPPPAPVPDAHEYCNQSSSHSTNNPQSPQLSVPQVTSLINPYSGEVAAPINTYDIQGTETGHYTAPINPHSRHLTAESNTHNVHGTASIDSHAVQIAPVNANPDQRFVTIPCPWSVPPPGYIAPVSTNAVMVDIDCSPDQYSDNEDPNNIPNVGPCTPKEPSNVEIQKKPFMTDEEIRLHRKEYFKNKREQELKHKMEYPSLVQESYLSADKQSVTISNAEHPKTKVQQKNPELSKKDQNPSSSKSNNPKRHGKFMIPKRSSESKERKASEINPTNPFSPNPNFFVTKSSNSFSSGSKTKLDSNKLDEHFYNELKSKYKFKSKPLNNPIYDNSISSTTDNLGPSKIKKKNLELKQKEKTKDKKFLKNMVGSVKHDKKKDVSSLSLEKKILSSDKGISENIRTEDSKPLVSQSNSSYSKDFTNSTNADIEKQFPFIVDELPLKAATSKCFVKLVNIFWKEKRSMTLEEMDEKLPEFVRRELDQLKKYYESEASKEPTILEQGCILPNKEHLYPGSKGPSELGSTLEENDAIVVENENDQKHCDIEKPGSNKVENLTLQKVPYEVQIHEKDSSLEKMSPIHNTDPEEEPKLVATKDKQEVEAELTLKEIHEGPKKHESSEASKEPAVLEQGCILPNKEHLNPGNKESSELGSSLEENDAIVVENENDQKHYDIEKTGSNKVENLTFQKVPYEVQIHEKDSSLEKMSHIHNTDPEEEEEEPKLVATKDKQQIEAKLTLKEIHQGPKKHESCPEFERNSELGNFQEKTGTDMSDSKSISENENRNSSISSMGDDPREKELMSITTKDKQERNLEEKSQKPLEEKQEGKENPLEPLEKYSKGINADNHNQKKRSRENSLEHKEKNEIKISFGSVTDANVDQNQEESGAEDHCDSGDNEKVPEETKNCEDSTESSETKVNSTEVENFVVDFVNSENEKQKEPSLQGDRTFEHSKEENINFNNQTQLFKISTSITTSCDKKLSMKCSVKLIDIFWKEKKSMNQEKFQKSLPTLITKIMKKVPMSNREHKVYKKNRGSQQKKIHTQKSNSGEHDSKSSASNLVTKAQNKYFENDDDKTHSRKLKNQKKCMEKGSKNLKKKTGISCEFVPTSSSDDDSGIMTKDRKEHEILPIPAGGIKNSDESIAIGTNKDSNKPKDQSVHHKMKKKKKRHISKEEKVSSSEIESDSGEKQSKLKIKRNKHKKKDRKMKHYDKKQYLEEEKVSSSEIESDSAEKQSKLKNKHKKKDKKMKHHYKKQYSMVSSSNFNTDNEEDANLMKNPENYDITTNIHPTASCLAAASEGKSIDFNDGQEKQKSTAFSHTKSEYSKENRKKSAQASKKIKTLSNNPNTDNDEEDKQEVKDCVSSKDSTVKTQSPEETYIVEQVLSVEDRTQIFSDSEEECTKESSTILDNLSSGNKNQRIKDTVSNIIDSLSVCHTVKEQESQSKAISTYSSSIVDVNYVSNCIEKLDKTFDAQSLVPQDSPSPSLNSARDEALELPDVAKLDVLIIKDPLIPCSSIPKDEVVPGVQTQYTEICKLSHAAESSKSRSVTEELPSSSNLEIESVSEVSTTFITQVHELSNSDKKSVPCSGPQIPLSNPLIGDSIVTKVSTHRGGVDELSIMGKSDDHSLVTENDLLPSLSIAEDKSEHQDQTVPRDQPLNLDALVENDPIVNKSSESSIVDDKCLPIHPLEVGETEKLRAPEGMQKDLAELDKKMEEIEKIVHNQLEFKSCDSLDKQPSTTSNKPDDIETHSSKCFKCILCKTTFCTDPDIGKIDNNYSEKVSAFCKLCYENLYKERFDSWCKLMEQKYSNDCE